MEEAMTNRNGKKPLVTLTLSNGELRLKYKKNKENVTNGKSCCNCYLSPILGTRLHGFGSIK